MPIENKAAPAIAGLSAALVGAIASEIDENSVCGMGNIDAMKSSKLSGNPSEIGSFKSELKHSCVLDFNNFQTAPNCLGQAKIINGTVRVLKAEKTLSGVVVASADDFQESIDEYIAELISNPNPNTITKRPKPILPNSNQPLKLGLSLKLENISLSDVCLNIGNTKDPKHCLNMPIKPADQIIFRVNQGEVNAELKPLTAKNMDEKSPTLYFCASKTPIGEASLTLKNFQAVIDRGGVALRNLAEGNISVVRGPIGDRENQLMGSLKVGDKLFEI